MFSNIIMAQKDGINACFRVFFVVLVVAVLAQSSCIDKARGSVGRNLMGGWRTVENPEDDVVVKGIVASGLKQYNLQSNDMHNFELVENGKVEAYSQLVNGHNYCAQFTLVSVGCKNSLNGDYCRDGKKLICSVSAYKSFQETDARIDPSTLACMGVA